MPKTETVGGVTTTYHDVETPVNETMKKTLAIGHISTKGSSAVLYIKKHGNDKQRVNISFGSIEASCTQTIKTADAIELSVFFAALAEYLRAASS